jgi:hypothetical protein
MMIDAMAPSILSSSFSFSLCLALPFDDKSWNLEHVGLHCRLEEEEDSHTGGGGLYMTAMSSFVRRLLLSATFQMANSLRLLVSFDSKTGSSLRGVSFCPSHFKNKLGAQGHSKEHLKNFLKQVISNLVSPN